MRIVRAIANFDRNENGISDGNCARTPQRKFSILVILGWFLRFDGDNVML